MVTKMTVKNQVTIPKRILERLGLVNLKEEERYFDIEPKDNGLFLKPVTIVVEERISAEQWKKFEDWATKIEDGDVILDSAKKATDFLKKKTTKHQ